jgi:hypothetical protein
MAIAQVQQGNLGGGKGSIAGIDRLGNAPLAPDRGSMTPGRALVLNIIVNEREIMENLDRRAKWHGPLRIASNCRAGQHGDRRPEAFAARRYWQVNPIKRRIHKPKVVINHAGQEWHWPIERFQRTVHFELEPPHKRPGIDADRLLICALTPHRPIPAHSLIRSGSILPETTAQATSL